MSICETDCGFVCETDCGSVCESVFKENSALPESVNFIATQRPQKEDPFPIQGGSTAR